MVTRMAIAWLCAAAAMLCACANDDIPVRPISTVEVGIPILENCQAPAALARTPIAAPVFISPTNPAARMALDEPNSLLLRKLLVDRETRLNAWEKWGLRL